MDSGTQQNIRVGQATPRLQKLSGDIVTNSYALVASGGPVRRDKAPLGLMKISELNMSEMQGVLAVRCWALELQSSTHNSAAVCLASYFPALDPDFLF